MNSVHSVRNSHIYLLAEILQDGTRSYVINTDDDGNFSQRLGDGKIFHYRCRHT